MILQLAVEEAELLAEAGDPHAEVLVRFGIILSRLEGIFAHDVELQLADSLIHRRDHQGDERLPVRSLEQRRIGLEDRRAAGGGEMVRDLRERLDRGGEALLSLPCTGETL